MLSKENAFFREMERADREYSERRAEHKARKRRILNAHGQDSEEMKAWYAEERAIKYPFTVGEHKAYCAWKGSANRGDDEVEMDGFLWENEVADFVGTLRKAGIRTFVYTNRSTAVIENLHQLTAAGCAMQGLCTIKRHEFRWGDEKPLIVPGVRFTLE